MGTVWRAYDELLGRRVAVKELHLDELHEDAGAAGSSSLREARAIARVHHPHIVCVHDVVEEDGVPYIVMELVEGGSLARRLARHGPLAPREAARLGLALLSALRAAHALGVLHRDLKPANVLLEEGTGRVVLTDFGIAQLAGSTTITEVGMFVGSPEYTAPERMRGAQAGPASDLWSLGALLCAALTGQSPFHRDSLGGVLHAVVEEDIRPPAAAGPLLPVVRGLLQRDPDRRMGGAEAERLLRSYAEAAGEAPGYRLPGGTLPLGTLAPGDGGDRPAGPSPEGGGPEGGGWGSGGPEGGALEGLPAGGFPPDGGTPGDGVSGGGMSEGGTSRSGTSEGAPPHDRADAVPPDSSGRGPSLHGPSGHGPSGHGPFGHGHPAHGEHRHGPFRPAPPRSGPSAHGPSDAAPPARPVRRRPGPPGSGSRPGPRSGPGPWPSAVGGSPHEAAARRPFRDSFGRPHPRTPLRGPLIAAALLVALAGLGAAGVLLLRGHDGEGGGGDRRTATTSPAPERSTPPLRPRTGQDVPHTVKPPQRP
ncbi:serine/threonine-protein kinase [Streptomyces sp. NPDC046887]|uniref:serine/threonine-protein kinase n=1 Tax=Streptomyces sp. NPDC046887 TaxID=3155472 RepID=UPI0033D4991E